MLISDSFQLAVDPRLSPSSAFFPEAVIGVLVDTHRSPPRPPVSFRHHLHRVSIEAALSLSLVLMSRHLLALEMLSMMNSI